MFLKNTASQFLYFTMISSADGSALTSAAGGYRTIDGGSQNAVTGSLSHKGNGQWELALSQADINGDNIGFLFTHATGVNVSMHINTTVKSIDTLQDITAANVRTQCDNALTAFGPNTVAPNTVVPDIAGTAATLHGVTDGKIDAAQGDLDTILDTSGAVAGAGAITFTYTLTNSEDDLPIADADFWVTSDLAGANVIASGKTHQYGKVTFYLDAGTVYVWRQKSGWDFTNPDIEIVA